jgi:hypothetical protein
MITLGIDLSSMPKGTAACRINWLAGRATAEPPRLGCTDIELDALIGEADAVGIDAPFGWPAEFVAAVSEWKSEVWNEKVRDPLRFRVTDLWIIDNFGLAPLSVSTDRIALPAMRAMALLLRHGVTDRSGDGKFFEVYPAGSLAMWELPKQGYKKADNVEERGIILKGLCNRMPWLDASDDCADSADALDSLVASLTARAAVQSLTHFPPSHYVDLARREGWIHLPTQPPHPDGDDE